MGACACWPSVDYNLLMMTQSHLNYDEPSDTLYVSFAPGQEATGIELNDHMLLRINKKEGTAVGLTLFEYSLLAQKTAMGPRSFPLTGLATLSAELQSTVWAILQSPPVNNLLGLLAYTPTFAHEATPIAYLHQPML